MIKPLGIGIGLLAAAVGGLIIYNRNQEAKRVIPPKEMIISLIKKLREQMFVVLLEISEIAEKNSGKIPPDHLKTIIMDESEVKEKIKEKVDQIFTEISEQDFEYALKNTYSEDSQIQYNIKQYQQQLEKAFLGVKPEVNQVNIAFLDKNKIMNCIQDILEAKINRLQSQKITKQNIEQVLKEDAKKDKTQRQKKLKELGLVGKNPAKLFQFTVSKYQRMDAQFLEQYKQIISKYRQKLAVLTRLQ